MVDVGLYAITPYQFRLAQDIGLDNFLSPTSEENPEAPTTAKSDISSVHSGDQTHKHTAKNGYHTSTDAPTAKPKQNNDSFQPKTLDSGIFTLTLERRPEKRERSRSGSDAISPEPKRVVNGPEVINETAGESDNSPTTTSETSCGSVFYMKHCSDTDDTNDTGHVSSVKSADDVSPGCCFSNQISELLDTDQRPPQEQQLQDLQDDKPVVVRRKRRPRKLPQIPANAQRKSVASLIHAHSIADELGEVDPQQRRTLRAIKSMSWVESTAHSSANSSQDSGSLGHGYQSLEDLGSPEDVGSIHMELVEKSIIQQDIMSQSMTKSMSQSMLQSMNQSMTASMSQNMLQSTTEDGSQSPVAGTSGTNPEGSALMMTSSMSMSLLEELQCEGVKVNDDLGSAFCDHLEYIDDDMPKLKRFFGDDIGERWVPPKKSPMPTGGARPRLYSENDNSVYHRRDDSSPEERHNSTRKSSRNRGRSRHLSANTGPSRRESSSSSYSGDIEALDPTHRGCHKFIPRHQGELFIEIGDLVSVDVEADDLWCEGVNLRTGKRGIFPAAYATDLSLLDENNGTFKFRLRFLGSVEVNQHKGNDVICTAIQKVVMSRRVALDTDTPPLYCVQINEYGIKMMDLSKKSKTTPKRSSIRERLAKILNKEYKEEKDTEHFFSLKHVSFCGYHPKNERYFAFITKHPVEMRFACHVFISERTTVPVCEAVGAAFKRFYQEYMAFAHPTEDIYLE